uniref:UspA domain-containing protein n=1 Tax=Aegilops tauschii subsp. strangulata TaxID=200361 RepID=A0A453G1X2_AEGTS
MASGSGEHFLRQLSSSNGLQAAQDGYGGGGGGRRRGSRRWSKKRAGGRGYGGGGKGEAAASASAGRKRVMVVVDDSSGAKHAMMWALTHVANRGDFLTLLHVLPHYGAGAEEAPSLANSLGTLCKACRPEVSYLPFLLSECSSFLGRKYLHFAERIPATALHQAANGSCTCMPCNYLSAAALLRAS